jgi:hypothetical protein
MGSRDLSTIRCLRCPRTHARRCHPKRALSSLQWNSFGPACQSFVICWKSGWGMTVGCCSRPTVPRNRFWLCHCPSCESRQSKTQLVKSLALSCLHDSSRNKGAGFQGVTGEWCPVGLQVVRRPGGTRVLWPNQGHPFGDHGNHPLNGGQVREAEIDRTEPEDPARDQSRSLRQRTSNGRPHSVAAAMKQDDLLADAAQDADVHSGSISKGVRRCMKAGQREQDKDAV